MSIVPKTNEIKHETHCENWLDSVARIILLKKLGEIQVGFLQLQVDGMIYEFGSKQSRKDLFATINVHNIRVFRTILFGGEPAAGKTYTLGWWSTEDLNQVIRIFTINREALFAFKYGFASLSRRFNQLGKFIRKNTKSGAKKNICAHYDIGNDFYRLFLDEKMMYSSAYFTSPSEDIERASEKKLELICEKLELSPRDEIVEIGSGWGGFAIYAAENYGCHVTTTTISDEQYQHVVNLVKDRNLGKKIRVLKEDYRNLNQKYDKLVSIEMLESVGHEFLETYFSVCSRLLKPDGIMLIQTITISDFLFKQYIGSMDFIRKYIFPGGSLPSVATILDSTAKSTDLTLFHAESFASSYARTLSSWYQRFTDKKEKVFAQGYSMQFVRLWEYYLKYCQIGFEERVIDVHQFIFKKPENRFGEV